jgi:hypothetical protein
LKVGAGLKDAGNNFGPNIFSKSTKKVARQTLMFYVIKKLNSKRF